MPTRRTTPTPNPLQRLVQALTATRSIAGLLSRSLNRLDRAVLALSPGRHTATRVLAGIPVLTLETLGARSGRSHLGTLLAIRRGPGYVLVAPPIGSPHHPAWYPNLAAHPDVRVTLNNVARRCRVRLALDDERQACWDLAVSVFPCNADYLERARRPIPVLVLTPID